jgi:hypothetical protein
MGEIKMSDLDRAVREVAEEVVSEVVNTVVMDVIGGVVEDAVIDALHSSDFDSRLTDLAGEIEGTDENLDTLQDEVKDLDSRLDTEVEEIGDQFTDLDVTIENLRHRITALEEHSRPNVKEAPSLENFTPRFAKKDERSINSVELGGLVLYGENVYTVVGLSCGKGYVDVRSLGAGNVSIIKDDMTVQTYKLDFN